MKKLVAGLVLGSLLVGGLVMGQAKEDTMMQALTMKEASITAMTEDSRTFPVDASISVKKVHFENRYGFTVAGDMYLPKDFDSHKKYKALVVSGPFGAVKEQSSGLYAQEMAKHGYVTVAFDPSMTGESSGKVREMASPDIFTEDYSAAVDFVTHLDFVDKDKVGAIGICGLSGMALTAAVNDVRIQAVAVSAMYDMSESIRDHYKGAYYTKEQRELVKQHLAEARDYAARHGYGKKGAHELAVDENGNVLTQETMFPNTLPADTDPVTREFYNYYVGRAYHPRAINSNTLAWDATTPYGFFNFQLMQHIDEISPRPVLLITGDKAHSKYFSDEVYEKLKSPKEEIVVPGATHTDLYDQMDKIPFDRLVDFFDKALDGKDKK